MLKRASTPIKSENAVGMTMLSMLPVMNKVHAAAMRAAIVYKLVQYLFEMVSNEYVIIRIMPPST
ncbi:hypothetical protein RS1P1_43380 [Pseudomonas moraviensis]|nr:hypothetical protein RS1P1_43380 [Pseudomonas moraviensis]